MKDYRQHPKENKPEAPKPKLTVSHLMIFTILIVYIFIIFSGLSLTAYCITLGLPEIASTIFIALLSYSGVCGSSTIIMYVTKAMKENEIKISNDLYRMKLELAKEIYQSLANNTLSEQAITLISYLIGDTSNNNTNPLSVLDNVNPLKINLPIQSAEDGLG